MRTMSRDICRVIENYIGEYIEREGVSPCIREIADGTDIPYSTVGRYLPYMREQGMISYDGHRTLRTKEAEHSMSDSVRVPVLGRVSCGVPKFAEENIEEYVRLPISIFGMWDYYFLRADGESMIDIGIESGDLVLIRKQNYAREGQIVVALVDDEATLKRYYPEPKFHRIRLQPENKAMKPIYVDDCIIQGVAVKVIRDLEYN